MSEPVFGRLLTALVTPFTSEDQIDVAALQSLAAHLVDDLGHDGLVINGTTGESPTTTVAEKGEILRAVVEAVGDRAQVVAGVGSYDTDYTLRLTEQAHQAGADGLLVVTPFYSKPPQRALVAHFTAVADATDLPLMLYDIPHRTGTAIETATFLELADHPRIAAVKDAKGDLVASAAVIAGTDLDFYAGDDAITLPLLSIGGVGVVGTSTHFTGLGMAALIEHWLAGDTAAALTEHRRLLPVFTGVFAAQGCTMVKAACNALGRPVGGVRLPMVEPEPAVLQTFLDRLRQAGLATD